MCRCITRTSSTAPTPTTRRCAAAGLTIRYIPTSTRITGAEPLAYAFLLRGEAVPGVNVYQPRPKYVQGAHMPFAGSDAWK